MSLISRTVRTDAFLGDHKVVELDVARHLWAEKNEITDPEMSFNASLTSGSCGVLSLNHSSLPHRIVYRLVNDSKSILLEPIAFNNNLNFDLHNLKINLPDQIIPNCFVINSFISGDIPYLIIDAISQSGVLFTISFAVSEFLQNSLTINSMQYEDWAHISNAYGFDLRKPHFLYSFNYDYTLVLLKDGGLIGLQKDLKTFNYEPILFDDNSYFESLGSFLKPWASKSKISIPNGLSEKTCIDCIHYEDLLITITINKKLRVWSKLNHSLLSEQNLNELVTNSNSNKDLFDSQPAKLLNILKTSDNDTFLSIFLPFGNGIFKIFKLQSSPLDIITLGNEFEFKSNLPESTSIWLVGDFKLIEKLNHLQLWVLWKSGSSSIIQSYTIDEKNPQWNVTSQISNNNLILTKFKNEDWSQFYNRKIFQSYNNKIILTALSIFQKHFLPKDYQELDQDLSILDKVNKTIGLNITFDNNYQHTIERQWFRFDSLCQEFQKQMNESLNLFIEDDCILLINKYGFSSIRNLTELELYSLNKSNLNVEFKEISKKLSFLDIISNFKKSLGKEIQEDLLNSIILNLNNNNKTVKEISSEIYDSVFNNRINPMNLNTFVQQLSELDGFLNIIEELIDLSKNGSNDDSELFTIIESKLTQSSSSLISSSLKQIFDTNFEILFDLFILLLVLEFEDKDLINSYLIKILKLFKNYYIFNSSYNINLNNELNIEIDENSEKTLTHYILDASISSGFQFNNDSLISIINNKFIKFINSNEFLYQIIIFLISNNSAELAYFKFLSLLDDSKPISNLLKSIVFFKIEKPEKSSKYLILNESKISNYKLTTEEKLLFKPIEDFTVFFNTKLSKYYLNLSILFLNNFYFKEALKFINFSISKKNFINDKFDNEYKEQKYHALFTIALELQDFNNVKYAINNIISVDLKKESLKRLISTLFKTNSINKLLEFEFLKDEKLIDQIIYEKAINSKNTYSKSLNYYKVLYSFRFKNKNFRASIESLYEFIYKFKNQSNLQELLTIYDFYTIILNLLKNFNEDDQWIIYHLNENEDDVLSFEDLKQEQQLLSKEIKKLQQ